MDDLFKKNLNSVQFSFDYLAPNHRCKVKYNLNIRKHLAMAGRKNSQEETRSRTRLMEGRPSEGKDERKRRAQGNRTKQKLQEKNFITCWR